MNRSSFFLSLLVLAAALGCGGDDAVTDGAVDGATDTSASDAGDGGDATDTSVPTDGTTDAMVPPVVEEADPTFGAGGLAAVGIGQGLGALFAMAEQSDGKIVAVGRTAESIAMARVLPSGALDTTFGRGGLAFAPLGQPVNGFRFGAGDVAVDPDGTLVVGGYFQVIGDVISRSVVMRYQDDGSLDTSFGDSGYVASTSTVLSSVAWGVAVQGDSKIVVGGTVGNMVVERLLADGTRDATFGTAGVVATSLGGMGGTAADVAIGSDGSIVAVGNQCCDSRIGIARFTSAGALDPSFGGGSGYVVDTAFAPSLLSAYQAHIESDGGIVVAASRPVMPRGTTFAVGRFDASGTPDASFGTNGWAVGEGTNNGAFGLAVRADGKVLAAGNGSFGGELADLVRFDTSGDLDATFGTGGVAESARGVTSQAIVELSDGSIVTAGSSGFVRRTSDGAVDTTFGTDGTTPVPFASSVDRALAAAVQPDGRIVVVGVGGVAGGSSVMRLMADGGLDPSFGADGVVAGIPGLIAATSVAIDASGNIVVGGLSLGSTAGLRVARLDTTGSPDATFGTAGVAGAPLRTGQSGGSNTMLLASDGAIMVAGIGVSAGGLELGVQKLDESGVVDATFGAAGAAIVPIAGSVGTGPVFLAEQSDGGILVAGATNGERLLVRFDATGTLDASFETGGTVTIDTPRALTLDAGGNIVLVTTSLGLPTEMTISRRTAAGALDPTFGTAGSTTETLDNTSYATAGGLPLSMGLAIAADGTLLVGAATGDAMFESAVLYRYVATGIRDSTFGVDGEMALPLSPGSSAVHAIVFQPDGRPLIVGRAWTEESGSDFAVLRLR